jgi:flagellar basal body-associated protein FliL
MLANLTGNKMVLGAVVGIVGGLVVAVLLVVVGGVGRPTSSAAEAARSGAPVAAAAGRTPTRAAGTAAAAGAHAADSRFGPTYVVKDRIVNLADPGGRRYLRFSVTIQFELPPEASAPRSTGSGGYQLMVYEPELDAGAAVDQPVTGGGKDPDKEFQTQIKPYSAAIEDAITSVLSAKTYDEIRSNEGKEQVKREIKDRVQRIVLDKYTVTDVFLTDFVVQ